MDNDKKELLYKIIARVKNCKNELQSIASYDTIQRNKKAIIYEDLNNIEELLNEISNDKQITKPKSLTFDYFHDMPCARD